MSKTYSLKITSGVVVNGVPVPSGRVVHGVDETQAKRLLGAGKAELATAEDVAAAPVAPEGAPDGAATETAAKKGGRTAQGDAKDEGGKK